MNDGPIAYPDHDTLVLLSIVDLTETEIEEWVFTLNEILDLPVTR